jgi:glutamyl-tRNA synthetase
MSETIVRFAPSPTGYLHLGGARTALYNWLFARGRKGRFLLRIEDTDVRRSTEESSRAILDGLTWLGMDWDGDPLFQSTRFDLHRAAAHRLVEQGLAYRCGCTAEELERKREEARARGLEPKYDRTCRDRDVPAHVPHAVRFKMPLDGSTTFRDILRGVITVPNSELDDLIILRSDGMPTYNFSVVIDDHDMGITHVVRGDDHLTNTPRQIKIYEILGWPLPQFAHLPLIAGLSKRKGSDSVQDYRARGFLPQAVVNYIVRMGWGWKDQEVFTMPELLEIFRLEDVGKAQGQMNEDKLAWLNGQHIRLLAPDVFVSLVEPRVRERGWSIPSAQWFAAAASTVQVRAATLDEAVEKMAFYFVDTVPISRELSDKFLGDEQRELLARLALRLGNVSFDAEELEKAVGRFLEEENIKLKKLAHPVRVALCGSKDGPGLYETMAVLGRDRVIERLTRASRTAP